MLYIVLDTNIMFENSFKDFSTFMFSGKFNKIIELINNDTGNYRDEISLEVRGIIRCPCFLRYIDTFCHA